MRSPPAKRKHVALVAPAYRQVGARAFIVPSTDLDGFAREWALGRVEATGDRATDVDPSDPRGLFGRGALPNSRARRGPEALAKIWKREGTFARVIAEWSEATWGDGWRLDTQDEAWKAQAEAIGKALRLRGKFEEADAAHLALGLSLLYLNLKDATGNPEAEPVGVSRVLAAQVIRRTSILGARLDLDPESPRFLQATAWQIQLGPGNAKWCHWQRVVEFREHEDPESEWDGIGLGARIHDDVGLKRNLEWAFGTAAYQRAAPLLLVMIRADAKKPEQSEIDAIGGEIDKLQSHVIQKVISSSFEVKALGEASQIPDPAPFHEMAYASLATVSGIPVHILKGSAAGELASSQEDTRRFHSKVSRRRENWAAPDVLQEFYARLSEWQVIGPLPADFEIGWSPLGDPSPSESMEIEEARARTLAMYSDRNLAPPERVVDYSPGVPPALSGGPRQPPAPPGAGFGAPAALPQRGGASPAVGAPTPGTEQALPAELKVAVPALKVAEHRFFLALATALLDLADKLGRKLDKAIPPKPVPEPPGGPGAAMEARIDDPAVRIALKYEAPTDELRAAFDAALRLAAEEGARVAAGNLAAPPAEVLLDDTAIRTFKLLAETQSEALAARLTAEVRASIAQGLASETVAQLRDRVTSVFDRFSRVDAERIARTESMRAFNQGARSVFRQVGIARFRFIAFDGACPICGPLNGKDFPIEDSEHTPPLHPSCRCVLGGPAA